MSSLTFPLTFGLTKADKLTFGLSSTIMLSSNVLLPSSSSVPPVGASRQAQIPGLAFLNETGIFQAQIPVQIPGSSFANEGGA